MQCSIYAGVVACAHSQACYSTSMEELSFAMGSAQLVALWDLSTSMKVHQKTCVQGRATASGKATFVPHWHQMGGF